MLSELCKDVGRNVLLHCSPWEVAVVGELLQIAQSIHHLGGQSHRLVPIGGEKGREDGMEKKS